MSLFSNMTNEGHEETEDRLGGFQPLETDIYVGTIKVAYASASKLGARNITLIVDVGSGKEYRETVYYTNRKGENFFIDKDSKKKVSLPGFALIDDICQVASGKTLEQQADEEKMVKVYDPDLKKEAPKAVPVLTDLTGQSVALGIVKVLENKSEKDSNGVYQDTADERYSNFIEKVFHPTMKFTVAEARKSVEVPAFWDSWVERNKGALRDKRSIKGGVGGKPGKPGASKTPSGPPQANASTPARKSLFAGKA